MALEEFFTLTEVKNGLTSSEKVNDLITAMQKDQDSMVNNFDQATKQWCTVAQTIAATEDRNFLDLFINLNGLSFIDKWLNDLQNHKNDTMLEDLIIEILKALERLQIDNKKSLDFGIGKTVKNLVEDSSSLIREKAKELCDKWMIIQDNDSVPQEELMKKVPTNQEPPPGDANLELEEANSKDEKEVNCEDKKEVMEMSSMSSPISDDVDNVLESSVNARGDKDEEMVDNGESEKIESTLSFKKSEMELDYGIIDPLEVARQVANEVEREVDDSKDQSCSTSETPKTPESESTIPDQIPTAMATKESETRVSKPDITVSQVSEVAQESESNTGKGIGIGIGGFDLNQEVCSEEVENSNPVVSVVSASRATASSEIPITPLQFEGTKGWKGSASTSAFKRVLEIEKTATEKRSNRLDFDLNVIDGLGPDIPSGEESSVDAGPTRPQLDLNSIGDEGADVARSDWWQSPSRSSSSSSKQPSRNIDLNLTDQPQESVISIFGKKFAVKKNLPQLEPSGRLLHPTVDFNIGRTNYNNQMFYGHNNGFPPGTTMYFATLGGPIPYMVDSRGVPVGPQMMGSSSTQPPFMLAAGGPSGSTGGAPPLHNFDLNSGLSSIVGGKRREPDGRWDFFPVNKHQQPPWR